MGIYLKAAREIILILLILLVFAMSGAGTPSSTSAAYSLVFLYAAWCYLSKRIIWVFMKFKKSRKTELV